MPSHSYHEKKQAKKDALLAKNADASHTGASVPRDELVGEDFSLEDESMDDLTPDDSDLHASGLAATPAEDLTPKHFLEKIPRNVEIKKRFEDHYRLLLGDKYDLFMNYSLSYIRKCIRVNTLKASVEDIQKRLSPRWNLTPIPWCPEGFWIEYRDGKRYDIGNLLEHHLGYVYVQESASMLPPIVLDPQPGETVLDLCAAPGSKTSQIAMYMQNQGLLIANDVSGLRLKALGMNLQRCGVTHAVLTMMQEGRFHRLIREHPDMRFDRILVDAPCSGTGTIRKSLKSIMMWNPAGITKLSQIQKRLLELAFTMTKPGGVIVYSTCTIEPEENEAVVSWLLEKYPNATLDPIDKDKLGITYTECITSFESLPIRPEVKGCLRIHPYDNNSEGFFVARIVKN